MISSHEVAEAITILGKIPISAYPGKSYDERSHNAVTVVDTLIEMSKTLRAFEERERKLREENKLLREALDADCTAFANMEAKLIEVAGRISGSNGGPPCHPDPILLSEWVSEINHAALKETPDAT